MSIPEFKDLRSPEIGELIRLDPVELIKNNPAGFIVNEAQYGRMNAYFSRLQYQPVQVARVIVSTPSGEKIEMKLIDGNTRTKFAADNKGKIRPEAPDYSFDIIDGIDVTDSLLHNPLVVYPGEQTGQKALTTMQYLRAVVEHTIVHSEIVVDRIAAHLVNGWEDMVGDNIARRFSALAALTLLWGPNISLATDPLLKRSLDQQGQFMAGETREERDLIEREILEMASIIRSAKLSIRKEEITRAAFNMVMKGSPEIGGEESAQREVEGLLYLEALEVKLAQSYPDIGSREEVRLQFGQFLKESLKKPRVEAQQIIDAFQDSIKDPELTLDQVIGILTSDSPRARYNEIKAEINESKLKEFYIASGKNEDLSEIEISLIKQLGQKTYLAAHELPGLASAIESVVNLLNQADTLRNQLTVVQTNAELPEQIRQLAQQYIENIDRLRKDIPELTTRDRLTRRINELKAGLEESSRRVNSAIRNYRIGKVVEEIFGEQRTSITLYIVNANLQGEPQARERLNILKGLDSDLQSRVIDGNINLNRALEEQKRRDEQRARSVTPDSTPTIQTPYRAPVATPPGTPVTPEVPPSDTKPPVIEEELPEEEKERRDKNLRLTNFLSAYRRSLMTFNLPPDKLDQQTKAEIELALLDLVKLHGGDEQIINTLKKYFSGL